MEPITADQITRTLIAKIATTRIEKGWTQAELGKRTGLSQTIITKIESLEYMPLLETFIKLELALGLNDMINTK